VDGLLSGRTVTRGERTSLRRAQLQSGVRSVAVSRDHNGRAINRIVIMGLLQYGDTKMDESGNSDKENLPATIN